MIDYRETLKKFHEILPDTDLDTLLKLMDGIIEVPTLNYQTIREPYKPYVPDRIYPNPSITCTYGESKTSI